MTATDPILVAAVMAVADRQHGLVTHAQLISSGVDRHRIRRLATAGWLRRAHRGVYIVRHAATSPRAREHAALLAYQPHSMIVHRSALTVWNVLADGPDLPLHVGVYGRTPPSRPGIVAHRVDDLRKCDLRHRDGLAVTSPARALLDAACDLGVHETEKAVDEALALKLVTRPALMSLLERYPRHRGAAILRALADPHRASQIDLRAAQREYGRLLAKAGAPPSRSEHPIGPYRVDRYWEELLLVVEIDGLQFHRDRKRMEGDNRRQDDLRHWGKTVTRFTARQVLFEQPYVMYRTGYEVALAQVALARRT